MRSQLSWMENRLTAKFVFERFEFGVRDAFHHVWR
jgi:hypothetical protein